MLTQHLSKGRESREALTSRPHCFSLASERCQLQTQPLGTSASLSSSGQESLLSWVTARVESLTGTQEQRQHLSHTVCQILGPGGHQGAL